MRRGYPLEAPGTDGLIEMVPLDTRSRHCLGNVSQVSYPDCPWQMVFRQLQSRKVRRPTRYISHILWFGRKLEKSTLS